MNLAMESALAGSGMGGGGLAARLMMEMSDDEEEKKVEEVEVKKEETVVVKHVMFEVRIDWGYWTWREEGELATQVTREGGGLVKHIFRG